MILLLATGIGAQVSVILTDVTGLAFPGYIGGMLTAVVIRNVMDAAKLEYPDAELETMGNMFLSIFLSMNLSALNIWLLIDLALPMIITLLLQCILMFVFSYFVVFNVMGRDYDAAVMTAGFIGFSMGATSNAMASMDVISRKYGPSPVAYFAIPMVGGMFIDFVNAFVNTMMINMWAIV
jgi:ESS family glutamate:Na+ symporter